MVDKPSNQTKPNAQIYIMPIYNKLDGGGHTN